MTIFYGYVKLNYEDSLILIGVGEFWKCYSKLVRKDASSVVSNFCWKSGLDFRLALYFLNLSFDENFLLFKTFLDNALLIHLRYFSPRFFIYKFSPNTQNLNKLYIFFLWKVKK